MFQALFDEDMMAFSSAKVTFVINQRFYTGTTPFEC